MNDQLKEAPNVSKARIYHIHAISIKSAPICYMQGGSSHTRTSKASRHSGCNIEDLGHSSRPDGISVSDGVGDEHEHIHGYHIDVQIVVVSSAPTFSINCSLN